MFQFNTYSRHGNNVVDHLGIAKPVNGIPAENDAGLECAPHFVDKYVVPGNLVHHRRANGLHNGRFASFKTVFGHEANDLGDFDENTSTRWVLFVHLFSQHYNQDAWNKHACRKEIRGPETNVLFKQGRKDAGESTNVDTPIEHVEEFLICSLRSDNNTFCALSLETKPVAFLLGANKRFLDTILLGNERGNIGFDTASSETDNDDGNDEPREYCSIFNCDRRRGSSKDDKAHHVNTREYEDSVVLAQPLVGNYATNYLNTEGQSHCRELKVYYLMNYRSNVAPKPRKHKVGYVSTFLTFSRPIECRDNLTGRMLSKQLRPAVPFPWHLGLLLDLLFQRMLRLCDAARNLKNFLLTRFRGWLLDVVLERTTQAVVGESLTELEQDNQESRLWNRISYFA